MGIDLVYAVETRSCGAGDKQITLRAEGEMIGGNAGLERGEDEHLLVAGNLENSAAAVADIEILFAVKSNSGGDSHAFGVGCHGAVGRHAIDGAVIARRSIHLALAIEGDGGGVHHLGHERFYGVVGVDLEDGDGNFLASSGTLTQTVAKASSTTLLVSSVNPSALGQNVTFTATVSGSGAPTGTVIFSDGVTSIGQGTLSTAGGTATASFSTGSLTIGSHTITASYGGDSNFLAGTGTLTQTVGKASSNTLVSMR